MAPTTARRKTVDEALATTEEEGAGLRRDLGRLDVVVIGVGVIIGAGIFVLTGQAAAENAGPAITLSFVVAGIVSGLAALCYAELAAMVPVAGSAYTFSYVTLGEILAFMVGWDLILEFTVGSATVAVGAGGYLNETLSGLFGLSLPDAITAPPGEGGVVNVPAIVVVPLLTAVLVRGIRPTARVNAAIVGVTIAVLVLVIVAGGTAIDTANWSPYFPFGAVGVLGGAAVVFFAYIGFDIVATTAEETRNPQSDMPVGIIGSLAIVTVLYVLVAAVITGMVPFGELAGETPVAEAFAAVDMPVITVIVFAGALLALFKTTLLLMLGQTRVAFAMARDRLLPPCRERLVATLGATNFIRFGVWLVLGVIVYFAYSRPRSTVGRRGEATA